MNALYQVVILGLATHLLILFCQGSEVPAEGEKTSSALQTSRTDTVRQKRAPGWGKRAGQDLDSYDAGDDLFEENDAEKRAPGWGKRAPGWGKRAPGWGKRAPGWGKRAPGWGKRAPGWGKRAPGWGKRDAAWPGNHVSLAELAEAKRAPGWGKRAPGWGKRAPGWGKRAPGWGKRAPGWGKRSLGLGEVIAEEEEDMSCPLLKQELQFLLAKAVESEAQYKANCGGESESEQVSRK